MGKNKNKKKGAKTNGSGTSNGKENEVGAQEQSGAQDVSQEQVLNGVAPVALNLAARNSVAQKAHSQNPVAPYSAQLPKLFYDNVDAVLDYLKQKPLLEGDKATKLRFAKFCYDIMGDSMKTLFEEGSEYMERIARAAGMSRSEFVAAALIFMEGADSEDSEVSQMAKKEDPEVDNLDNHFKLVQMDDRQSDLEGPSTSGATTFSGVFVNKLFIGRDAPIKYLPVANRPLDNLPVGQNLQSVKPERPILKAARKVLPANGSAPSRQSPDNQTDRAGTSKDLVGTSTAFTTNLGKSLEEVQKASSLCSPSSSSTPKNSFFLLMPAELALRTLFQEYLPEEDYELIQRSAWNTIPYDQLQYMEKIARGRMKMDRYKETVSFRNFCSNLTVEVERMFYEDKFAKLVKMHPDVDFEAECGRFAVPYPPIFLNHQDINRHISQTFNGSSEIDRCNVFKTSRSHVFKTSRTHDVISSTKLLSSPNKVYLMSRWSFLHYNREFMTPEQLESLRRMWLSDEECKELRNVVGKKDGNTLANTTEEKMDHHMKTYEEAQKFFGADRVDFATQYDGFQIPPIYVEDKAGNRCHINDYFKEPLSESSTFQESGGTIRLESFKSSYSFIFDDPLTLMTSHCFHMSPTDVHIYYCLNLVLYYLDQNPFMRGIESAEKTFMEKLFNILDNECGGCVPFFEEDQVVRIAKRAGISRDEFLDIAVKYLRNEFPRENETARTEVTADGIIKDAIDIVSRWPTRFQKENLLTKAFLKSCFNQILSIGGCLTKEQAMDIAELLDCEG